jgi:hypothetical protein
MTAPPSVSHASGEGVALPPSKLAACSPMADSVSVASEWNAALQFASPPAVGP